MASHLLFSASGSAKTTWVKPGWTTLDPQSYRKMAELYTSLMFFTSLVLRCNDLQSRVLPQKTCFLLPYTIVKKSFWICILAYLCLFVWSGVWARCRFVCCKLTWVLRCNDLQSRVLPQKTCFFLPYTIELNPTWIYIIHINSAQKLAEKLPSWSWGSTSDLLFINVMFESGSRRCNDLRLWVLTQKKIAIHNSYKA